MALSQIELATVFSYRIKSLQSQTAKMACDAKRKQLFEVSFHEFSSTDYMFLKKSNFS